MRSSSPPPSKFAVCQISRSHFCRIEPHLGKSKKSYQNLVGQLWHWRLVMEPIRQRFSWTRWTLWILTNLNLPPIQYTRSWADISWLIYKWSDFYKCSPARWRVMTASQQTMTTEKELRKVSMGKAFSSMACKLTLFLSWWSLSFWQDLDHMI